MELSGTREIAADRQTVWAALNDPRILRQAIPGCQEMTGSPEEGFEATVKQKVGPVSATFKGRVTLTNVVPGESYTITGEGKGGAAGFAKGGADMRLEDSGGGTRLSYDVRASVGGKLAQLGGRVIDGFAKKTADAFFDNFRKAVEGSAPGAPAAPDAGEPRAVGAAGAAPGRPAAGAPAPPDAPGAGEPLAGGAAGGTPDRSAAGEPAPPDAPGAGEPRAAGVAGAAPDRPAAGAPAAPDAPEPRAAGAAPAGAAASTGAAPARAEGSGSAAARAAPEPRQEELPKRGGGAPARGGVVARATAWLRGLLGRG